MSDYTVDTLLADLDAKREYLARELAEVDTAIAVIERTHPRYLEPELAQTLPIGALTDGESEWHPPIRPEPTPEEKATAAAHAESVATVLRRFEIAPPERPLEPIGSSQTPPHITREDVRRVIVEHGRFISRMQIGEAVGHLDALAKAVIVRVTNAMLNAHEIVQIRFERSNRRVYYGLPSWLTRVGDRWEIDIDAVGPTDRVVSNELLEVTGGLE